MANSVDPDQTPHSAASDLGLHCLPMSPLWDARHKWVKDKYGKVIRYFNILGALWISLANCVDRDRVLCSAAYELSLYSLLRVFYTVYLSSRVFLDTSTDRKIDRTFEL